MLTQTQYLIWLVAILVTTAAAGCRVGATWSTFKHQTKKARK